MLGSSRSRRGHYPGEMISLSKSWVVTLVAALFFWLVACEAPPPAALPTRAAAAQPTVAVPPATVTSTATLSYSPTPLPTVTATASSTPAPSPTATTTPCSQPGEVISANFTSAAAGGNHAYRVYLPPCYGLDGRVYPTLYLFAGNIHDESKWDALGLDEAADEAIMAGEAAPFLVVMPAGGWLADNSSGGPGSYETLVLDELIPHVEATYCASPEPAARAIGGISRGGYWALEIAFRFPELFRSVGAHSAALLDSHAGPTMNPQQTALHNDLGALRIYLDIGAGDYLRANTIQLHDDMTAAGVDHDWRLNEGRHEDAYWAAQIPAYLRWYVMPWTQERDAYPACSS